MDARNPAECLVQRNGSNDKMITFVIWMILVSNISALAKKLLD